MTFCFSHSLTLITLLTISSEQIFKYNLKMLYNEGNFELRFYKAILVESQFGRHTRVHYSHLIKQIQIKLLHKKKLDGLKIILFPINPLSIQLTDAHHYSTFPPSGREISPHNSPTRYPLCHQPSLHRPFSILFRSSTHTRRTHGQ